MSSSSSSGNSQLAGSERQRYAYRFTSNDGQRYLYIQNFGKGALSQAQLVKNVRTNQVVVRKVTMVLSKRHDTLHRKLPLRPLKPREIVLLDLIRQIPGKSYIATYYSYEYVKAGFSTTFKVDLYRLVSYWPVYNGGAVAQAGSGNVNLTDRLPLAAIGRLIWQVYRSLHHMYHCRSDYIIHFDLHLGNIVMHWPGDSESLLPDFIIMDFGESYLFSEVKATKWNLHPELSDVDRMNETVIGALEELGVVEPCARARFPAQVQFSDRLLPGPHSPVAEKLLEIYQTGKNIVDVYAAKFPSTPEHPEPPSLMELVRLGKEMEAMCLAGGVADETKTNPVFQHFVTEARAKALATGRAMPFTAKGPRDEAMRPVDPKTGKPLELYGPWTLCRNIWKAVQDGPPSRPDPSLRLPEAEKALGGTDTPLVINLVSEIEEDYGNLGNGNPPPNGRSPKSLVELNKMVVAPQAVNLGQPQRLGSQIKRMVGAYPESINDSSSVADTLGSDPSTSPSSIGTARQDGRKLAFALKDDQAPPESFIDLESSPDSSPPPVSPPQAPPHIELHPPSSSNLGNFEQALANAISSHELLVSQQINILNGLNQQMQQGPLTEIRDLFATLDGESKRLKRAEDRQNHLHAIVHHDKCDCDSWFEEVSDRLEMDNLFNNMKAPPPQAEQSADKGKQREGEPPKKTSPIPQTPVKRNPEASSSSGSSYSSGSGSTITWHDPRFQSDIKPWNFGSKLTRTLDPRNPSISNQGKKPATAGESRGSSNTASTSSRPPQRGGGAPNTKKSVAKQQPVWR